MQIQGIVTPTDEHQRVSRNHDREQIGNVAEEIHEQAGEPGTSAARIILHAGVMTDTGPARI